MQQRPIVTLWSLLLLPLPLISRALDTGANQVTAFLPTAFSPGNFGLCDIIADFVFQCMAHRTDIVVIESAGAYFDVSPLSSRSWRVTSQAEQRRVHFVGSVRPVPLVEAMQSKCSLRCIGGTGALLQKLLGVVDGPSRNYLGAYG
ncbi:hypothetical protein AK812_SmicGene6677 [Symbiodinium microadriaticum]|uniref:Uncharacterized protein n=1 Tax=Symbiodinium microadriaticum TaxID=2951 RepID=A0A1Q9EQJ7_SYMMI|nr:hypothetical protein AK812_SmicGene6677 [Symbiodinium microadriaticum]